MEIAKARTLTEQELADELADARRHLYDLRFQLATRQAHRLQPDLSDPA